MLPHFLLGVSTSDSSGRASAYAIGVARRSSGVLIAAHVVPEVFALAGLGGLATQAAEAADEAARRVEETISIWSGTFGVECVFVCRRGRVSRSLATLADEFQVDEVIIGASRIPRRAGPSVSSHLIRHAAWPVTVVP